MKHFKYLLLLAVSLSAQTTQSVTINGFPNQVIKGNIGFVFGLTVSGNILTVGPGGCNSYSGGTVFYPGNAQIIVTGGRENGTISVGCSSAGVETAYLGSGLTSGNYSCNGISCVTGAIPSGANVVGTETVNYGNLSQTPTSLPIAVSPGGAGGGSANPANIVSTTFSATPTFTCTSTTAGTITTFVLTTALATNITSSTLSGCTTGQELDFLLAQDATGGRTISWPTGFSSIAQPSPVASVTTLISCIWDGTNCSYKSGQTLSGPAVCIEMGAPGSSPPAGYQFPFCDSTGHLPRWLNSSGIYFQGSKELTSGSIRVAGGANAPDAAAVSSNVAGLWTGTGCGTTTNAPLLNGNCAVPGGTTVTALPPYFQIGSNLYLNYSFQATSPPTTGWTPIGTGQTFNTTGANGAISLDIPTGTGSVNVLGESRAMSGTTTLIVSMDAQYLTSSQENTCVVGISNGTALFLTGIQNGNFASIFDGQYTNSTTNSFNNPTLGPIGRSPVFFKLVLVSNTLTYSFSVNGYKWTQINSRGGFSGYTNWVFGGDIQGASGAGTCFMYSWNAS